MSDPSEIETKVDALAQELNADIVVYFGDVTRAESNYLIQQANKRKLRKNILLLLMTLGGDPNAAYRIARCFQTVYNTVKKDKVKADGETNGEFTVLIDGVCKSAGTIMCIGADKLLMSPHAELGPIDVQLRKQDEVGERTSGLTPIQAVQFLETQSTVLFKRHFKSLRFSDDLGFSTKMAAHIAADMTVGLLRPIYEQIDPLRLAEVDRSLRIGKEYGERLQHDNLKDEAINKLVVGYPSHGFVIDKAEAATIFKSVGEPTEAMQEICNFFKGIAHVTIDKDDSFVYYWSSEPKGEE